MVTSDEVYVEIETEPTKVLIVDDDKVSVMAIRRALKKMNISNPVVVATDGEQALECLRSEMNQNGQLTPFLVTLDLNMPRMNGFEFLEEVRIDPELQRSVIFVLSTSDAPSDIASAYNSNIAGYIVKDNLNDSISGAFSMLTSNAKLAAIAN